MGGFALALGGAGQAAQQYGQQMRQMLEERRGLLAQTWAQQAASESDPEARSTLLQNVSDLLGGKPIGGIIQDHSKAVQKRVKDNQALQNGVNTIAQNIGQQPPAPPPPPPGATPVGQPAGTGSNASPPSAAQPATSPIAQPANGGQIQTPPPVNGAPNSPPNVEPVADVNSMPPVPAQAPAAELPPVAAAGALPVAAAAPTSLAPIIKDPQDIMNKYMRDPRWSAPANRPVMQSAMNDELTHNEALRQQADLVENRIRLMSDPRIQGLQQQLKQQGYSEYQIPSIIGSIIGAPIPMMPGIGSALYSPERLTNLKAGDIRKQYPGMFDTMLAGVSDNSPVTLDINKVTREPMDVHVGAETTRTLFNDAGDATLVGSRSGVSGAPLTGLHSAGQATPVSTGVNSQGHQVYQPRYSLLSPSDLPVVGSGVNPGFISSTSVSTQPGAPPIQTTRSKGGGRAVLPVTGAGVPAVVPPAINGGGLPAAKPAGAGGTSGPRPVEFNDPLAKANYENLIHGRGSAPTGRQLDGVKLYAQSHGLPMPDEVSAAAQTGLRDLDPIIQEVDRTTKQLQDAIDKGYSKLDLAWDYAKYHDLKINSPETALISNLSFSALRSTLAAMKGSGSRAYPIISKAMEHTPELSHNPDSPAKALTLLKEMKTRLQEGRAAIIKDDSKTGVVPQTAGDATSSSAPGSSGLGPPVTADPDGLRQFVK